MKLSLADLAGRVKLSLADLAGRVKGNLPGLAGRMPQSLSRLAGRVQLGLPVAAGRIRMPGLAGRLAIVTGVLVTLAVASMLFVGVRSLRSLAQAEALTRVELGVSAAREGLRQSMEDVLTAARILGERPPLQRLLRGSIRDALPPYLTRYCESAALDACAIVQNGELIASTAADFDWKALLVAAAEQGERFLVTGAAPSATTVRPAIAFDTVTFLPLRSSSVFTGALAFTAEFGKVQMPSGFTASNSPAVMPFS